MAKEKDPHKKVKRQKDLTTLKDLLSLIPRQVVDQVLDEALGDQILTRHVDCLLGAEGVFRSTTFHLYDAELRKLLADLFTHWNAAWETGLVNHHEYKPGLATLTLCDTATSEQWREHAIYLDHVGKAREAMAAITVHLHEAYPDFDLTKSDKEASRKYHEALTRAKEHAERMWGATAQAEGDRSQMQGNTTASTAPRTTHRPDVVIVTVNEHETRAVLAAFREATGAESVSVSLAGRAYNILGTVNGTTVYHAVSEMGSGGSGAMQQTVEKAINALSPGAVIAVGIAFGVNEKKQAIGDILVSKLLRLYELQRVNKTGTITLRGALPDSSSRLLNHFRVFHQTRWTGATVRFGLVLTGEKLVDDIDYRDQLVALEEEAVGGEMEGAGLYVSSYDNKVDWIVVKAICDWGDGNKEVDKTPRQQLAAKNAAEFVVQSLKNAQLRHPNGGSPHRP